MLNYPTDLDGDEEDSVLGSHHTSDKDSNSNDGTDIDEYASFDTDIGKYQYDQLRWNGTEHGRKYKRAPKHKEECQKKANSLEYERENSQSTVSASTRFYVFFHVLKATLSTQIPAWNVFNAAGLGLMSCWGTLWLHSW